MKRFSCGTQSLFLVCGYFVLQGLSGCSISNRLLGAEKTLSSTAPTPTPVPTFPFKVTTDFESVSNDYLDAMVKQSDGKILIVGHAYLNLSTDIILVRYNLDGSLDTSFGTNAKVSTDFGSATTETPHAIALQSDGKILVVGSSDLNGSSDFAITRYNSDGSLDATFGTGGFAVTDFGAATADSAWDLYLLSNGKILVAGTSDLAGSTDFALARYNSDGTLDTSFGTGGKVVTDIGTSSADSVRKMSVLSDGSILLAGNTNAGGSLNFALVRYTSAGVVDASFGTSGKVVTDFNANSNDFVRSMAVQSDGKILIAGAGPSLDDGSYAFVVLRYNTDGSLDGGFATGGKLYFDFGTNSYDDLTAMSLQADGKIIVAGSSDANGDGDFAMARITAAGALDTTFGVGGKRLESMVTNSWEWVVATLVEEDGKILFAGPTDANDLGGGNYDFTLARIQADGQ